jgi:hypothetical protein
MLPPHSPPRRPTAGNRPAPKTTPVRRQSTNKPSLHAEKALPKPALKVLSRGIVPSPVTLMRTMKVLRDA